MPDHLIPTPTASLGREAGQAVRWNAAASLTTLVSQFLQIVFLARWLSPAEFGLAAVALAFLGFLQGFCDLGLTNALVQRERIAEGGWSSAWWGTVLAGLVLCAALVLTAPLWEGLMHLGGLAPLLALAALALPGSGPAAVFQAHLQRHLRFRRLAVAEIGAAAAGLTVGLTLAFQTRRGYALVAGIVTLNVVRMGALAALSKLRLSWRLRRADLVPLSAFGGYQMGERALTFALSNLDRMVVARLLGAAATGYYAMASQIALRPAMLLGGFVGRTLMPLLSRLQGDRPRLADSYLRSLSMLGLASALVYALLFGLATPLVRLVLGAGWEPAILTLRILALLGFLTVLGNAFGNLTLAMGRARAGFWLNVMVLVLQVAGVWVGTRFGLTGVAWALVLVSVLSLPFDLWLPRRWLGIAPGATALAAGWPLLPALLTAGGTAWLSLRLPWAPLTQVLLLGPAALSFFLATAWALHRRRLLEAWRELAAKVR